MDLLRTKHLEKFIAEFPYVIVDRKIFENNLSRCVKLFRETGGVYRRKTTDRPLKPTAAVIETAREIMQNAPHQGDLHLPGHDTD
jgi:hypothetical protein